MLVKQVEMAHAVSPDSTYFIYRNAIKGKYLDLTLPTARTTRQLTLASTRHQSNHTPASTAARTP